MREIGKATNQVVDYDTKKNVVVLGGKPLHKTKQLIGSGSLVKVADLKNLGAALDWDDATQTATLHFGPTAVQVKRAPKRVVVDQGTQTLTAYQGEAVVMQTHVSTGREGHHTPNGHFIAGPTKERMHYSHLYEEAPMPYSVQVDGNVFIHGFSSVPRRPASHGCVRMPLGKANPARSFYEWVDVGTPVTIQGRWSEPEEHERRRRSRRRHTTARRSRSNRVTVSKSSPVASAPAPASSEGPQAVPISSSRQ